MGSAAAAGLFAGGSAWAASAGANVAVVPAAAAPPTIAVFRKSRRPNPSLFMTISPGSYRLLLARSMLSLIGTSKAGICSALAFAQTLPWRGRVGSHEAERNVSRGGVVKGVIRETLTPPRLLIAFAIDPPPPGEGDGPPFASALT